MKKSHLTTATLVLASLAAGTAFSQSSWVEVGEDVALSAFSANAGAVSDWDVHAPDGTEIGEVEEVLGADAQTAEALAVDFDGNGGFTDRDVVVPLDQFVRDDELLVLNADAASVEGMELYEDD